MRSRRSKDSNSINACPERAPASAPASKLVKLLVAASDQQERLLDALAAALLQQDGREAAITLATELVGAATQTPISQKADSPRICRNKEPNQKKRLATSHE